MNYRLGTKLKSYLFGGLAAIIAATGATVPAFAVSSTTAKGDVGYSAYGLSRHAKFNVDQDSNTCTTKWNVSGNYNFAFNLNGDPTQYVHEVTLDQNGNNVKGTGGYPVGGPHSYEWKITSGNVNGTALTFNAKYTLGADALTPVTKMTVNATIASNGTISGTWSDNYQGGTRAGQVQSTSGNAIQKPVGCQGDGNFKYTDVNGNNYKVDVRRVNVVGNDAWFAGPVESGNVGAGQWLFAKVHDGGSSDQIWGSFTDKATAKLGVALMNTPTDGPFAITSGNIKIN